MAWHSDSEIAINRSVARVIVASGSCNIAKDIMRHPSLTEVVPVDGACEFCDIARNLAEY